MNNFVFNNIFNIDVGVISDFGEDTEEELEDFVNVVYRRPRFIQERVDHLNYWDDVDFKNRFRLSKITVHMLLLQIEDLIKSRMDRNAALSPIQQLLICLRFYATGSFQINVGDHSGVHQSTTCKTIKKVTRALCSLKNTFIKIPEGEEIVKVSQGFFNIAAFPQVLLVLDGTHIRIQNPGGDQAEWFRNRKGFFSINAMIACDHDMKIRNIVSRWPGSVPDVTIFNNSALKAYFDNGNQNSLLIGDSGYAIQKYLMTPLDNPANDAERLFQESIVRTRNIIERTIGVWKRRFPCLAMGLRPKIPLTQDIIVATAVLHNLAINENDKEPPEINGEMEALINDLEMPLENNERHDEQNDQHRTYLINNYFNRLH